MLFRKTLLSFCSILAISVMLSACGTKTTTNPEKKVSYPEKTIKLINYGSKGSGPDETTRKIAELLQKQYGWNFEITNADGNKGADALKQVWEAPHDGYTILGQSENVFGFGVSGVSDLTAKNWTYYQILQQDAAIVVKADSKYKTIEDLIKAAKENPNSVKVANGGLGKSAHLKIKIIEKVSGAKFEHIAYKGADKGIEALMNGEVDAVSTSTSTVIEALPKNNIKPLVITDNASVDFGEKIGRVESITKLYPEAKKYLPLDTAIGFAMPADVPNEAKEAFGKAFEAVLNSPEGAEYLASRKATKLALWGDNSKDYATMMERNFSWGLKEIGMSKVEPETLGISKPE